jgi:TPP-dependent pyruvate/acetoin dehydrogenase alpha subunit
VGKRSIIGGVYMDIFEQIYEYEGIKVDRLGMTAAITNQTITGLTLLLVDKGLITNEEYQAYQEKAKKIILEVMKEQQEKQKKEIEEKYGAFGNMLLNI